jgi:hypothetical protein
MYSTGTSDNHNDLNVFSCLIRGVKPSIERQRWYISSNGKNGLSKLEELQESDPRGSSPPGAIGD